MAYYEYQSPLGITGMTSKGNYLTALYFVDQKSDQKIVEKQQLTRPIKATIQWLDLYFAGKDPNAVIVPLDLAVTNFRQRVLAVVAQVPYGKHISYGDISQALQADVPEPKNLSQAVGGAVGHNPILLIVPCHRIVGSDGSLTGYAGGLERKKWLLDFEAQQVKL
ncbi:methylated-DNA--[protein]-cysteine S-methyltransferase [Convivina praedatoris]|uniref:Methylated-DNA--protein-cysteine methyltransferase n=1 Tax=Convivina praedatoris TaxID=2880963 RepID=A0ABM9D316_9LACO|nr:methylated-DNA--[protein]-cysteine S-methyltransferase [Convivina sp. LMG 32447]CAH1851557.1 Methylated-DNA--protein-cysteine methyltransferase [Convivina sp. LMG 32447]CAH1853604.1 Methylated-DNA--protein-cysteine methyltransferase [Convivina sp. LMG 32447]CAH1854442.1 Methylated-DNA--protein-cysteine methyltransferase [Convivina sp. LMG 32447]